MFHNLNTSLDIVGMIKLRMVRWMGHVAHMRKMRNAYIVSVRKPEGKRPGCRLESSIKMNIKKHRMGDGLNCLAWILFIGGLL
jgi:hypothetical protein